MIFGEVVGYHEKNYTKC